MSADKKNIRKERAGYEKNKGTFERHNYS